jgi:hypothetical protein
MFNPKSKRKGYLDAVRLASDPEARALAEKQELEQALLQQQMPEDEPPKKKQRKSTTDASSSKKKPKSTKPTVDPKKELGEKLLRIRIRLQKFLQQSTPHQVKHVSFMHLIGFRLFKSSWLHD